MKRRHWIWPAAGLAVLLVGIWGYGQFSARARWENRVETQYQRAFNDLTQNLGGLETQLARASVSNSPRYLRQNLADIWRLAYAAQEKLGQLPLGAVEMSRMKLLLAKVAAYSYQVTDRPAETLRLTDAEWKTLQGFRGQARYVSGQLTSMQANILQNNLRWVDVDRLGGTRLTAAAVAKNIATNKVTKSLTMIEDGLQRVPDSGFPESAVIFKPDPKGLTGKTISTAEGARIAAAFAGAKTVTATYAGKVKGDIASRLYRVVSGTGRKKNVTRVSVTDRGGKVGWMLVERSYGARRLSLARATEIATKFVADKGYADMTVVQREEFGNVDVITLCPRENGVIYYPEVVKVQVAMDNGQVVGFEGMPYVIYHDASRRLGPAKLTAAQARAKVSEHLKVAKVRQTVVVDPRNREIQAYEVAGTLSGERFLVYLNADDGTEIKIRRVDANGVEID